MICYNVTIKIDPLIEKEWIDWQLNEHIPEVMSTSLFDEFKFFKLLEQDEDQGPTYVVQYFSSSLNNYKNYVSEFAPSLRDKAFTRWGDRFIAFRTVMELVH